MFQRLGLGATLSREELQGVIANLKQEVETLRKEKEDLEIILELTSEHSEGIEYELNEENKAVRRELQIGRQIQADFLPETLLQPDAWQLASYFQPAREVAGDFYDAFTLPNDCLGIVIADVCDKGVGAALFMALTRSLLRVLAQQAPARLQKYLASDEKLGIPSDIAEILRAVTLTNDYIVENHSRANMFATLFFGVLDTTTGDLFYVNAGHDSSIHLGPTGIKGRLGRSGPPIGTFLQHLNGFS